MRYVDQNYKYFYVNIFYINKRYVSLKLVLKFFKSEILMDIEL